MGVDRASSIADSRVAERSAVRPSGGGNGLASY